MVVTPRWQRSILGHLTAVQGVRTSYCVEVVPTLRSANGRAPNLPSIESTRQKAALDSSALNVGNISAPYGFASRRKTT